MSQDSKLALIREMIEAAEASLKTAKALLLDSNDAVSNKDYSKAAESLENPEKQGEDTIVEGVFNGQIMIDKNGKEYPVPANYASKSKLIPGDVLKLTIKEDGTFLYKQIGPIERKRIIGVLTFDDGQYKVIAQNKAYKTLLASVTYFKAEIGDKITLIVPEVEDSEWGAIENVLPKDYDELTFEG